ncbi:hypothetical protein QYF61_007485 [Mycteria americana]|uniref:Integrase catalytic domain-containing protein n=1 Tax=Mycteria americana TaxID=33587 RepID=A0AAN7N8I5_MYCAM|nr:hypothetical protein QYF61_007485 [Mycteria americana]
MDTIAQVTHECETCAAIKQSKRLKPLWYGGRWLKYKYGEAWQIDSITLPQTRQGKRYVLTMVEATTGWLETYPVPHATTRNTILGLEKQVLWRHGTPERIESDDGTHFQNNLIDTWAKEHGIEWVYHIPYHAPASWKIERYNGLLQWIQDYTESNGWWDIQTLGYTFSKGHLVQDRFHLDLSDEEAVHYMQSLIDESVHAHFAAVVEQIHKFAQVSKLHSIRADKKEIDQIFPKTLEIEEPEPLAALKEEQEYVVLIKLGNRDSQDGDGWNLETSGIRRDGFCSTCRSAPAE